MLAHRAAALISMIAFALVVGGCGSSKRVVVVDDAVAVAPLPPQTTQERPRQQREKMGDVMRDILESEEDLELELDDGSSDQAEPAETFDSWDTYQHEHRDQCVGDFDTLRLPDRLTFSGGNAAVEGYRMRVELTEDLGPTGLRLGLLGAPKDALPATHKNLERFLEWFRAEGVHVIIVNGDIGYSEEDLEPTFELLARSGLLVIVHAGNADPVGEFNRAARKVSARSPNLINGNFVRLVEIGSASLVLLPGYHDARYISSGAGCQYYGTDVAGLARLVGEAAGTPIIVAHGPPRGEGAHAIDNAWDAGNVGDEQLTKFLAAHKVRFGLFGHILEAGARGVDPRTGVALTTDTWSDAAWLNAGSSTSLAVDLHHGTEHKGMAGVVEFDRARMRYRWNITR